MTRSLSPHLGALGRPALALAALHALSACGGPACDADSLAAGSVSATIDGEAWVGSGATWSQAGDAVQLTTAQTDGWRLTLVAADSTAGDPVADRLVDGATVEVDLGDGSFGALYPTDVAGSYATEGDGDGSLVLHRVGDEVTACFSMTATASDGDSVELRDGALRATCVGCD